MDAKTLWKVSCVLCVHYHMNRAINEYLKDQWDGCKHNEWGMWLKDGGNSSWICKVMKKIVDDKQNMNRTNQTVNQMLKLKFEHERMQTWWTSNIPSERMLKKIGLGFRKDKVYTFWKWNVEAIQFVC
jgi:hypothetical protein